MSRLVIPSSFIESKCFVSLRGVFMAARADDGSQVQVPGGAVVTLKEDHEDSIVFDNPSDGLLGPKGQTAMSKDQIGFVTQMSSIERASTLPRHRN